VAEGRLLDLIRRMYCFGVSLMKMDVRQESTRHTEAIDSITRYTMLHTAQLYKSLLTE
jgi:phosphoenolpyruvate carboxylase